ISMTEGANDASVAATTHYTYDKVGDLVSVVGPRPHALPSQPLPAPVQSDSTTQPPAGYIDAYYTYDVLHRQLTASDGMRDTTHYTYDAGNNVASVTDPRGFTTFYTRDEFGNILTVDETHLNAGTSQQGGVTYYQYDGSRNKIAQQDAKGNLVRSYYDKLN